MLRLRRAGECGLRLGIGGTLDASMTWHRMLNRRWASYAMEIDTRAMSYSYVFDETRAGTFRLSLSKYRQLHEGLRLLRNELESWNVRARDEGARASPYGREVDDLGGCRSEAPNG